MVVEGAGDEAGLVVIAGAVGGDLEGKGEIFFFYFPFFNL